MHGREPVRAEPTRHSCSSPPEPRLREMLWAIREGEMQIDQSVTRPNAPPVDGTARHIEQLQ